MNRSQPRPRIGTGRVALGTLLVIGALPAGAAERLSELLREFRAPPAAAAQENLHGPAVPLQPTRIVADESRSGYAAWAADVFSREELADFRVSAPDVVSGADGLTNLEKYALGLDPRAVIAPDALPEVGQFDEHWFLWYRRPTDTDDVEYRVEASTDGGMDWSSNAVTQEPILAADTVQSWQAHYRAAPGEAVQLRLVITLK